MDGCHKTCWLARRGFICPWGERGSRFGAGLRGRIRVEIVGGIQRGVARCAWGGSAEAAGVRGNGLGESLGGPCGLAALGASVRAAGQLAGGRRGLGSSALALPPSQLRDWLARLHSCPASQLGEPACQLSWSACAASSRPASQSERGCPLSQIYTPLVISATNFFGAAGRPPFNLLPGKAATNLPH